MEAEVFTKLVAILRETLYSVNIYLKRLIETKVLITFEMNQGKMTFVKF